MKRIPRAFLRGRLLLVCLLCAGISLARPHQIVRMFRDADRAARRRAFLADVFARRGFASRVKR